MRSVSRLSCRLLWVLLSFFRNWKNTLIAVLFTSLTVTILVQKYSGLTHLQLLIKYDFAELPTQSPSDTRTEEARTGNATADINGIRYFEPSKCPRSIASLPNYSQWFRERFKPNIKLFLDKRDSDNVRNLSFYELPFGFKNENHTLISHLLRHENFKNPVLSMRQGKECTSCAVVGSGGILNGSQVGKEIDSHDFVFRLNAAVTYGRHAEDVGRRTDFYMFFPESAHLYRVRGQNATLLYTMYKTFDVNYGAGMLKIDRRVQAESEKIKIIHPDFFRYVFAKFLDGKSMKPTTGALVVLLAIHLCDSVTIYGFGYDPRFSMHYDDWTFTQRTYMSTWTHDVDNEKRLWDKLHNEGAIRFFKRDVM